MEMKMQIQIATILRKTPKIFDVAGLTCLTLCGISLVWFNSWKFAVATSTLGWVFTMVGQQLKEQFRPATDLMSFVENMFPKQ